VDHGGVETVPFSMAFTERLLVLVVLACGLPFSGGTASDIAGSTVAAVYPPPDAVFSSGLYPDPSQVGFAGPTPSEFLFICNYILTLF
jgi:hypothetical protein